MLRPSQTAIGAPVDGVTLTPVATSVASVEVPILTARDMSREPAALAVGGSTRQLWAPCQTSVVTCRTNRVGVVAIDAEDPGCFVEGCWIW